MNELNSAFTQQLNEKYGSTAAHLITRRGWAMGDKGGAKVIYKPSGEIAGSGATHEQAWEKAFHEMGNIIYKEFTFCITVNGAIPAFETLHAVEQMSWIIAAKRLLEAS